MALSYVYAVFGNVPAVAAFFFGLKAAVLAIVLQALHRIASRALKGWPMLAIAALAFVGIFFFAVPFPLIVLAAGLIGFVGARAGSRAFQVGGGHGGTGKGIADSESLLGENLPEHARPTVGRAARVSAIWLSLWLVPVIAVIAARRARRHVSPRSARSFRKWRSSRSAALTLCSPIWRSRRSRLTAG